MGGRVLGGFVVWRWGEGCFIGDLLKEGGDDLKRRLEYWYNDGLFKSDDLGRR